MEKEKIKKTGKKDNTEGFIGEDEELLSQEEEEELKERLKYYGYI